MTIDAEDRGQVKCDRRAVLASITGLGIGTAVFHRALAQQVTATLTVTPEMIQQAEWVAGLELADVDRDQVARRVQSALGRVAEMRNVTVGYDVPPALLFNAAPTMHHAEELDRSDVHANPGLIDKPDGDEAIAFLSVNELAGLIRTKQVSSTELTTLYLDRLHRFDKTLKCVVTFTDDLALSQAKQADDEISRGHYRGPLHGIPWGAKDLIAYPGYKTTWGATPFRDQRLDVKATVAERLDQAGAVLAAKLSLGALAMGDKWFGGMTRNPWNIEEGSSGSSAGSASAVAAGLVGFALGSETLGSIVSPCRRCGTSGLRPTFGRVSRYGCMTLAWSMDKIGPICRSLEDCAIVFGAIHGHDGRDGTAVNRPFIWPLQRELSTLRVGYLSSEGDVIEDREELRILKKLGVQLSPIQLPDSLPVWAMTLVLNTEAATVFDELNRNNVTEGLNTWPNSFRQGAFLSAVDYLRANRLRTMLMKEMETLMSGIDCYVGGDDLAITNLTGHPTVVSPNGFEQGDGVRTPNAITFTGRLFGESSLLAVADAYQQATGFHREHPTLG
ncbi:MAG: amidase [Planctomycetaceae bacterium]|nr:amidase [Planctomycetales bacterium]MCB9927691.1 amidase [Planctomycetaceae bacterium]